MECRGSHVSPERQQRRAGTGHRDFLLVKSPVLRNGGLSLRACAQGTFKTGLTIGVTGAPAPVPRTVTEQMPVVSVAQSVGRGCGSPHKPTP